MAADRLVQRLPALPQALATTALVLALMLALYRLGPRAGLLASLSVAIVQILGCAAMLRVGWWMPPGGTLLAIALAYPLWSWRRLEVTVRNLRRQARAIETELSLPRLGGRQLPAEPMARDLARLANAANQAASLRRLLAVTIQQLPHPALITDLQGRRLLANERLTAAFPGVPGVGQPCVDWLRANFGADAHAWFDADTPAGRHERRDPDGRDWLVELGAFNDPDWMSLRLLQFVEITAIRSAEREREQTLRFLSHDLRAPLATILAIVETAGTVERASARAITARSRARLVRLRVPPRARARARARARRRPATARALRRAAPRSAAPAVRGDPPACRTLAGAGQTASCSSPAPNPRRSMRSRSRCSTSPPRRSTPAGSRPAGAAAGCGWSTPATGPTRRSAPTPRCCVAHW